MWAGKHIWSLDWMSRKLQVHTHSKQMRQVYPKKTKTNFNDFFFSLNPWNGDSPSSVIFLLLSQSKPLKWIHSPSSPEAGVPQTKQNKFQWFFFQSEPLKWRHSPSSVIFFLSQSKPLKWIHSPSSVIFFLSSLNPWNGYTALVQRFFSPVWTPEMDTQP